MIVNPVLPIWVLVLLTLCLAAFAVWQLIATRAERTFRLRWVGRLAMILLLLVIAIRPTIPGDGQGPKASGGLEVYFVVDTTSSMAAEDFGNGQPRLDGVKADIAAIAEDLSGAQFSLVTFDAAAVQRVPLTSDVSALLSATSVMQQEVSGYSRGSSIDAPVELLEQIVQAAVERNPDNKRIIFYLGDGEQTAPTPPGSFESLAPFFSGAGVLGYGTAEGGVMKKFSGYGDDYDEGYIQDYSTGADAISRIDEAALRTIADQLGVPYFPRSAGESVARITQGIDVGQITVAEGAPDSPIELYWIFAIPLGLLALLEGIGLSGAIVELRGTRKSRA